MPVSSRAPAASVLVVPHASHRPWVPEPLRSGRGSDAALQARLDRGPHGVPRGCQLSSQSCNGGSFEAQLSDRPADRLRPQTRPGCAHLLAMLQECRRLAGAFAASPAPYCSTGTAQEPRPWARRSPPPPRARDREQVTPQPGQRAANTGLSVENQTTLTPSDTNQTETLQVNEQTTPTKRHRAAAGRVRHHPRPLTTAGVEVRSSSRTSTSTRNPRPTPTHPHSTLKSRNTKPGHQNQDQAHATHHEESCIRFCIRLLVRPTMFDTRNTTP